MSYNQILRRINRIIKGELSDVMDRLKKDAEDLDAFDRELRSSARPGAPGTGGDTRGSDTRGSDTRGTDTRGTDTRGTDTRGTDPRRTDAPHGSTSGGTSSQQGSSQQGSSQQRSSQRGSGSSSAGGSQRGSGSSSAGGSRSANEGLRKPGERDDAYYYAVLGLAPGASVDTIKSTYKRLMRQYHPDRVSNLPPQQQKTALEKAKAVNEAYQIIERRRGFK